MMSSPVACGTEPGAQQAEARATAYPIRIEEIREGAGGEQVAPGRLEPALEVAFGRSPRFALADVGDHALSAEVWYQRAPADGGGRAVELSMRVEAPAELRRQLGEASLEAHVSVARLAPDGEAEDLEVALGLALRVLEARLVLADGDAAQIERLLESDDHGVRLLAIEWVRDHGLRDQVGGCRDALGHENPEVSWAAVECIGAVGDQADVAVLLQHLRLADPAHTRRTYEALAEIGGDKALKFLRFAAQNEDDPERRKTARRALERLELRQGAPRPSVAIVRETPRGHR